MRKPQTNSEREAAALHKLRELGGDAVRHGIFFVAGGFNVTDTVTMQRLADRDQVVIEAVGASTFASIREDAPCRS